jgi:hypothetical protein
MMMTWRRALPGTGGRRLAGGSARRGVMVVIAAGAAVLCAGLLTGAAAVPAARAVPAAAGARAAVPEARWGRAEKVPGTARLNTSGNAQVNWVSCWSVNNCAAGGFYTDAASHSQGFVVAERNGRWGKARRVPGLGALNAGGNAAVTSLSCAPGGYCVAGGSYTDAAGNSQGFVVTGVKGRWRMAEQVPGLAALNTSGNAAVNSVSCPVAGECAAAGSYAGNSGVQGFVVSEENGVWGTAAEVLGLAGLNVGGSASVSSLSCGSAGNCAAGGSYTGSTSLSPVTGNPVVQVFVVSEAHGVWGTAEEVPGTAALNTAWDAQVASVSCARDGYCAVGGSYQQSPEESPSDYPFVADERDGRWHTAVALGGPAVSGTPFDTDIYSVSCPSAGSCVAVGGTDGYCCNAGNVYDQAFVATQARGVWGGADLLPGRWARGWAYSVSCPSAGNCGVGGVFQYYNGFANPEAFVASETNGHWATAEQVPGMGGLAVFGAWVNSVSCPSAGHCTAAGTYQDHNLGQAFVTAPG